MGEPRIAARTPTACSGCYGQYAERIHVDFASAMEGAFVSDAPRAPRVEWVILCENCLRRGAELLPEYTSERDKLRREVVLLQERVDQAEDIAARVEDLAARVGHRAAEEREPRAPRKAQRRPRYEPAA